ncbi:uncharacterized protein LOC131245237 [Magnolia sinica]|uniref:uncharacterized protein LOC131245237 n=1 Tax=Magnolia sinica TaxID=86752 RepID=UPI00265AF458|nr:uncharacterized protein LOC131245237 [Magnolia sinica]
MHRSSSAGTLNVAASMTDEAGQDSPVRFSDKCIIRPTCHNKFKPTAKLEPIPSFSAYDKDEIECKEGEENDEEFSFPAMGGHDPDNGEVNKIGVFRSLSNLYGRGSYFPSSLENQIPWPSPSALYMATGLGIDHPPAMNKLNKIDDERLQQHYEKIIKEDPCNPLVLRNYARYLHETKRDYKKAEEFYSRAILAGPDDGEVLSEYASLSWEVNRDENKAFDCFQQAIRLSPEDSHVLAAYASFLWESGEGDADQPRYDDTSQPCCAKP